MAMASIKKELRMKFLSTRLTFVLIALCLIIIASNVFSVLFAQQGKYLSSHFWTNFPGLKQVYLNSQYVNKHPTGWIPDEVVNAYAGGAYVQGVSPILIASDTPPLRRYLIGLSAILFDNVNVLNVVWAVGSLFVMYLIGMQLFRNHFLALLAPTFLSFEPLFLNQLIYTPLLDIIQLFFLLLSLYFFQQRVITQKEKDSIFSFGEFLPGVLYCDKILYHRCYCHSSMDWYLVIVTKEKGATTVSVHIAYCHSCPSVIICSCSV